MSHRSYSRERKDARRRRSYRHQPNSSILYDYDCPETCNAPVLHLALAEGCAVEVERYQRGDSLPIDWVVCTCGSVERVMGCGCIFLAVPL